MEIISRKNKATGLDEQYIMTTGQIVTLESTSKLTKLNSKAYGHFSAIIAGKRSSGIVYDKVAQGFSPEQLMPGASIQVEALVSDVQAGINKNWKVSLPVTESLGSELADFVKGI